MRVYWKLRPPMANARGPPQARMIIADWKPTTTIAAGIHRWLSTAEPLRCHLYPNGQLWFSVDQFAGSSQNRWPTGGHP